MKKERKKNYSSIAVNNNLRRNSHLREFILSHNIDSISNGRC
jgi:hypothetical protein